MSKFQEDLRRELRESNAELDELVTSEKVHRDQLALIVQRRAEIVARHAQQFSNLNKYLAGEPLDAS